MKKQIKTSAGSSIASYLFAIIFGIAGLGIAGYGVSQFPGGSTQQFAIALFLGVGFLVISVSVIRASLAESKKIAWLNENGIWITAKPIDHRIVTAEQSGRVNSFCLILKAVDADCSISELANLEFESEPIHCHMLFDDYQEKEYDVVIDPSAPKDRYHVNADLHTVLS